MLASAIVVWALVELMLLWATLTDRLQLGILPVAAWLAAGGAALVAIRWRWRFVPIVLGAMPGLVLWAALSSVVLEQRARVLAHSVRRAVAREDAGAPDVKARPSIVIVVADALRADHLPIYGYHRDTAPAIESFARESTVFDQAYAQAPSTKPAIASLFTSKYPAQHGAIDNDHVLADRFVTLAEVLRDAGYRTAAFVENPIIGREFGYDSGFEHWVMDPRRHTKRYRYLLGDRSMSDMDAQIRYWIEEHRSTDFFLYIHYIDPHSPYRAPDGYLGIYARPERSVRARLAVGEQAPEDVGSLIDRYDEEIRYVDERFAGMVRVLEKTGILSNTVVIFPADHGEGFGEHGYLHHSSSVYSDLIRIPFFVRYPPRFATGRSDRPVQHIDVFPTILEIARIDADELELEGQSFARPAERQGTSVPAAPIVSEHLRQGWGVRQRAVVQGGHKLVHSIDRDIYELFDSKRDPSDATNLIEIADPDITGALRLALETHVRRIVSRDAPVAELPPAVTEALRKLGYVE